VKDIIEKLEKGNSMKFKIDTLIFFNFLDI